MGKITDAAIQALLDKRKQLDAQIQAKQARLRTEERKKDTRRKIILGGALLAAAKSGEIEPAEIASLLSKYAQKDASLFPDFCSAPEPLPEPTPLSIRSVLDGY